MAAGEALGLGPAAVEGHREVEALDHLELAARGQPAHRGDLQARQVHGAQAAQIRHADQFVLHPGPGVSRGVVGEGHLVGRLVLGQRGLMREERTGQAEVGEAHGAGLHRS